MIRKAGESFKTFLSKHPILKEIWDGMSFVVFILIVLWLTSCENKYQPNNNYVYTFSAMTHKDDYGRKQWSAHHFVIDEQIKNLGSFKECYVNYLEWSGLDPSGTYKKVYYADPKNINIYLFDKRWGGTTIDKADLCNVD